MQSSALKSLKLLRTEGRKKALLISATGTGKTYLSTFDVKIINPKRFLFVVHRENIARTVMKSFKRIFGDSKKMGILTGFEKEFEADYIFSTIQTLSKPEILKKFSPDYFDYIVIDEVHRSGAKSYRTILEYFNPTFYSEWPQPQKERMVMTFLRRLITISPMKLDSIRP
jgi:superfamily II DNA or RNA helicase